MSQCWKIHLKNVRFGSVRFRSGFAFDLLTSGQSGLEFFKISVMRTGFRFGFGSGLFPEPGSVRFGSGFAFDLFNFC